jgi:ferredoxin--NADP+ reductase
MRAKGSLIVVIGAGPAGIGATTELSQSGSLVALLNRDIRPFGLGEYGIYFRKVRMKRALRERFKRILLMGMVHYFGNVLVSDEGPISLKEVQSVLLPDAVLIATGAQRTKFLGIPGETLRGVYHAKDLDYHYNALPPFSRMDFRVGERVAIIGMGNVMVDIARYLIEERRVPEVTIIARRGPSQRAFTDSEFQDIATYIDRDALKKELERVWPRIHAKESLESCLDTFSLKKEDDKKGESKLYFRFLSLPCSIQGNKEGNVAGVLLEEAELKETQDGPEALGKVLMEELECDTVIFAIGDRVDETLGLPLFRNGYLTLDAKGHQLFNPDTRLPMEGVFVAGWAKSPSKGLVGHAMLDGKSAAKEVLAFLESRNSIRSPLSLALRMERFYGFLSKKRVRFVRLEDVLKLDKVEERLANELDIPWFKLEDNDAMIEAIEKGMIGEHILKRYKASIKST